MERQKDGQVIRRPLRLAMAAHESPRTTKLYDRTGDETELDDR
jgi:hypothetical protein